MKERAGEILAVAVAVVILSLLFWGVARWMYIPEAIIFEILVTVLAIVLLLLFRVIRQRGDVSLILEHAKQLDEHVRAPILLFLRPKMQKYLEESRSIVPKTEASSATPGTQIDGETLQSLVKSCFDLNKGSYQGTDSHKPSDFLRLYPRYVWAQRAERLKSPRSSDIRFLLVDPNDLMSDFSTSRKPFTDFWKEHAQNGISLHQCNREYAVVQARRLRLPSPDIGVFGWRFVVFFSAPMGAEQLFRVSVFPLRGELKHRIREFLSELNEVAKKITIVGNSLSLNDRTVEEIANQRDIMLRNF